MPSKRKIFLPLFFVILVIVILITYLRFLSPLALDINKFQREEYNTVFVSMFPIDNYNGETFSYYYAQNVVMSEYELTSCNQFKKYLNAVSKSGNEVSLVYLGVDPTKVSAEEIQLLMQMMPQTAFNIVLPYYPIEYWTKMRVSDIRSALNKYYTFINGLMDSPNCFTYFFSKEWLLCNPANYSDKNNLTPEISDSIISQCNISYPYYMTQSNLDSTFNTFTQLIDSYRREAYSAITSLTDLEVIFFGDSIIGNYTDSTSIPGVVNGLTGARTFNCGYGGNTATDTGEDISLTGIADAFINKDISNVPVDTQVHKGLTEYISTSDHSTSKVFVINYGLNDYYRGLPLMDEKNSDNPHTYYGAINSAVKKLQSAYPDAYIILMTPNFTTYFTNGEEIMGEEAGALIDYVNAVKAVVQNDTTGNVLILDNYSELGINAENSTDYLLDGCHPNEQTRFIIGKRICDKLTTLR